MKSCSKTTSPRMMTPPTKTTDQEKLRRTILQTVDLIAPLPDLVVRLLTLLNSPGTEPSEIERYLATDHVLVGKMLAMVNSPFYGLNRPITNIRTAIMVLGFRGLRSLLLASSAAGFMTRDYSCYGYDHRGLWNHALAVATAARFIAKRCGFGDDHCEEMMVIGLLHDIGKMLIAPHLVRHAAGILEFSGTITELEQRIVGLDHTEAGSLLAAKWNLSELVQEGIKHHHGGEGPEEFAHELAVVRLANAVAHRRGFGYARVQRWDATLISQDLELLSISSSDLDQMAAGIETSVRETLDKLRRILT